MNVLETVKILFNNIFRINSADKLVNKDPQIIDKPNINTLPKHIKILNDYNINIKNSIPWQFLVIHHSATVDTSYNDFDAIKKFHMSWKNMKNGTIINEIEAKKLLQDSSMAKYIKAPFKDIAYNFLFEFVGNNCIFHNGRNLSETGAHAIGFNGQKGDRLGIGICFIGNYSVQKPSPELLSFSYLIVKSLIIYYNIPISNVIGHFETFILRGVEISKDCPGKLFSMAEYRKQLMDFKI